MFIQLSPLIRYLVNKTICLHRYFYFISYSLSLSFIYTTHLKNLKTQVFRQALQFSSIMQQIKQYVHITISFMRKLMSWNAKATVDDDSTVHITKREAVKQEAMSNQKINWLYDNVSTYAGICILGGCMHKTCTYTHAFYA